MGMTSAKYFPQPTPYGQSPQQGAIGATPQAQPAPDFAPTPVGSNDHVMPMYDNGLGANTLPTDPAVKKLPYKLGAGL